MPRPQLFFMQQWKDNLDVRFPGDDPQRDFLSDCHRVLPACFYRGGRLFMLCSVCFRPMCAITDAERMPEEAPAEVEIVERGQMQFPVF